VCCRKKATAVTVTPPPLGGGPQAQAPGTPLMSDRNFYEQLEVEQDASVDQIKDQFTILEATFDSLSGDVVKSLKRARDILTVPSSREMYDKKLKGATVSID
jgi:recombinational DNA repair protein (RecF pathway)